MFTSVIWDIYAWSYDSGVTFLKIYDELLESVIKKLAPKKSDNILDIGCGTGNLEDKIIKKHLQFKKILATDISESMLYRARKKVKNKNISFMKHDANNNFKLPNESIDTIVMIHSLYALRSPQHVLKKLHQILKKGGKLIVANPYDKNGVKKIKTSIFKGLSFSEKIKVYLTKLPIIIINKVISNLAKSKSFHFIDEEKMSEILKETNFTEPERYEKVYADTDILFVTYKK